MDTGLGVSFTVNKKVSKEDRVSGFCYLLVSVSMYIQLKNGLAKRTMSGQSVSIKYTSI